MGDYLTTCRACGETVLMRALPGGLIAPHDPVAKYKAHACAAPVRKNEVPSGSFLDLDSMFCVSSRHYSSPDILSGHYSFAELMALRIPLTRRQLSARGWTDARLPALGPPDSETDGQPAWTRERVLRAESQWSQTRVGRTVERYRECFRRSYPPEEKILLIADAIAHFHQRSGRVPERIAGDDNVAGIVINYLRHQFTNYDSDDVLPRDDVRAEVRERFLEAARREYPWLAKGCEQQRTRWNGTGSNDHWWY